MAIGRVVRVELKDQYVTLSTAKDERFAFAYADVLGLQARARPRSTKSAPPASASGAP